MKLDPTVTNINSSLKNKPLEAYKVEYFVTFQFSSTLPISFRNLIFSPTGGG